MNQNGLEFAGTRDRRTHPARLLCCPRRPFRREKTERCTAPRYWCSASSRWSRWRAALLGRFLPKLGPLARAASFLDDVIGDGTRVLVPLDQLTVERRACSKCGYGVQVWISRKRA